MAGGARGPTQAGEPVPMRQAQATLLLHSYVAAYGEDNIIRRIVLGVTYHEVMLTERWRHPPQPLTEDDGHVGD